MSVLTPSICMYNPATTHIFILSMLRHDDAVQWSQGQDPYLPSSFVLLLLLVADDLALRISRLPLPSRRHERGNVEAREDVPLGVEHNLVQRNEIALREEQVEILERLGLVKLAQGHPRGTQHPKGRSPTIQKLSRLSRTTGGILLASLKLVKPPPSSTAV